MYCPRCSREQVSDDGRFCSTCGFKLTAVKSLLEDGNLDNASVKEATPGNPSPRQRDVNLGALLMFISNALMIPILISQIPRGDGVFYATLTLSASLIAILLFSHPLLQSLYKSFFEAKSDKFSLNRRDMNWGAILMFLCSFSALMTDVFIGKKISIPAIAFGIPLAFLLILFAGHKLLNLLYTLFYGRDYSGKQEDIAPNFFTHATSPTANTALPPMQSIPVSSFNTQPVNTAEMVKPPSITEHTTRHLDNS